MEFLLFAYIAVGIGLTIRRTADPTKFAGWMLETGPAWYASFLANVLLWPTFASSDFQQRPWSGYRILNISSALGMLFMPKKTIKVNALHEYHPDGFFRMDARVPLLDIAHCAEGGELFAMREDRWSLVGIARRRPDGVAWLDERIGGLPGARKDGLEWYAFITKARYEELLLEFADPSFPSDISGA